ncbi:uncharacterized protein LOC116344005 [Contarinia nasturtii]|uniref:uncharacterized protein LOC116344005 n=1 Tax=Contarinia nasturtii TaxID=265458 RepID=UPI0012D3F48C|nr:uncharacterized protein LOC116344005 [Contarinia nasturtii]
MPQKDYIKNKKSLPKLKNNEKLDNLLEENVEELPKMDPPETYSLYVRGAAWIKDRDNAANRLKEICSKIQDVRHPRQKSADYCFIDFASASERDQSYEQLKTNTEITVKPVIKDVPKLLEKRKHKVAEKREAKIETRKLLAKIKKNEKKHENIREKTNQIIIANLPKQTTNAELKQQFTNAVKINLNSKKKAKQFSSAILTFASPRDAYTASKQSVSLHGQTLNVLLNTGDSVKRIHKRKPTKIQQERKEEEEPQQKLVKTEKK